MSYNVIEEFIVMRDGAAVHYSDVGTEVDLTDDEAAEPLAAGKIARPGEELDAEPSRVGTGPAGGEGSAGDTAGTAEGSTGTAGATADSTKAGKGGKAGKAAQD